MCYVLNVQTIVFFFCIEKVLNQRFQLHCFSNLLILVNRKIIKLYDLRNIFNIILCKYHVTVFSEK